MGHHFGKFFRLGNSYLDEDRVRTFLRRNRKKILLFLGTVTVVGLGFLVLIIYFGFQFLQKALQIISGSSDVIAQNQGAISQLIQWGLSMFRQWGFLLSG